VSRSGVPKKFMPKQQRRGQDGAGEDDRHHAAGVDLQRQVGRLAAHHLAADDALGVLHRNAALGALDEDDEGNDRDHAGDQNDHRDGVNAPQACRGLVVEILNAARQADDDTGEDQQRHTVADAALGDLLAQPHDEGGAGGQREHAQRNEAPRGW
jgi:hypothetical protein